MFQDSLSPRCKNKWYLENYRAFDYSYIDIYALLIFYIIINYNETLRFALAKHSLCLDAFLDFTKTTVG